MSIAAEGKEPTIVPNATMLIFSLFSFVISSQLVFWFVGAIVGDNAVGINEEGLSVGLKLDGLAVGLGIGLDVGFWAS